PFLDEVRRAGHFAVSVLAAGQQDVSRYFSTRGRGRAVGEFPGVATESVQTGAPVVSGALAWFDARLHDLLPGGDHEILIGEVIAVGGGDGEPLLYWAGDYRTIDRAANGSGTTHLADAISVHLHLSGLTPAQLIDAQECVEPAAARLAARHRTDEDLAELAEIVVASRAAAGDHARFTAESVRFHDALGQASGNPAIVASLHALRHSRQAHYAPGTTAHAVERTLAAHEEILDAIRAGDADGAADAVRRHLDTIGRRLTGRRVAVTTGEQPWP
ncbi:MAG: FCD domain-containing protein, partial [Pseudonocardia sp.]